MSDEVNTIEVAAEPEKVEAPNPEVVTRQDLKQKGWSKAEMDSAEKRGMIPKPDSKKPEPTDKKPESDKGATPPEPERKPEPKPESTLPDFTFKTPEQEKAFVDAFGAGTPQRAMYFRMKNERLSRQNAESERDRLALEVQMFKDARLKLEDRPQVETDAEGNVIDPEDKPLTMKQLKAMQKAEQDELTHRQRELETRSATVSEALKTQEEFAKSSMPDFDDTVRLAADLVQNIDQIPEKWKRDKVIKLVKDLQVTAATADKYGLDDYNAPMISYEIGQLHPNYGKKNADTDGTPKVDPKVNGNLTPEQMKRIEENTQRRASSASLPGSSAGRRVISIDDLTPKDALRLTAEQRFKLKKDHPEKWQKLMQGPVPMRGS